MVSHSITWSLYSRKFAAFFGGCAICHALHAGAGLTSVISAALAGTLATLVPWPARFDPPGMQLACYAGAFFGMGSPALLSGGWALTLGSALGALVYVAMRPRLQGLGGRLGLIAFVTSGLLNLIKAWVGLGAGHD